MPNVLASAVPNLEELHMRSNAIFALPTDMMLPQTLTVLDLSLNKLASIPDSTYLPPRMYSKLLISNRVKVSASCANFNG